MTTSQQQSSGKITLMGLCRSLYEQMSAQGIATEQMRHLARLLRTASREGHLQHDRFGLSPVIHNLYTAHALCSRVSPDPKMVAAIMLRNLVNCEYLTLDDVKAEWGEDVAKLLGGLRNITGLYAKQVAVESDNFRRLLMTFAEDIRVIIIMIIDRLELMKLINHHPNERLVREVAYEANFLYAPLAHRLGLYAIKGEIEDMSLKYTNRKAFDDIAQHLNETKANRDAYIADFIKPVREKLDAAGIKYEIKGRTKSIFSIWNKLVKQKTDIAHIYDLFAIRIIIDTPPEREKADCWLAYSIVTDMYRPNPARMKDWISIPKSNGYESLHITVAGPDGRWVEVQIRTRRMDLVAEKGVAAHWRYKGIKSEGEMDTWMNKVRNILEGGAEGPMELMRNFKMDFYDKEVFVFTPKGDLYKLPLGATVLDFAFNIHSRLGCQCTGASVNGKNQKINYRLRSGDTVEILTSNAQSPKQDWLNFVVTSKARTKIRQTLNERSNQASELAKEMLQRRFKNRKIDLEEAPLMRTIKKLGYKTVTDFYNDIAKEVLDINTVIEAYEQSTEKRAAEVETRSAGEFVLPTADDTATASTNDVLVIGNNIKGINYRLARCCNPIHGDEVFGFISSEGVVSIHRADCPNAIHMRRRYPYRVVPTRWSGKIGDQLATTLRVVGNDDIGIVTNISSIINKEKDVTLRAISIDSNDGLFQGHLSVGVNDVAALKTLIKKIKTIKGVKDVQRI
ncbi:MAG: bifunctional (p)ppGpp synthetase/guanosine-3',5'-bis(diphosphate) 3'-pyrophosphohydrolase [Bacteroidales bacterium]|nr:bifunctional (p)ppGpp synthetase/guanosine-3',5'-bis(diphosphate) 3'-pyrophosphohydrolase [Bacteroidales bacterium]